MRTLGKATALLSLLLCLSTLGLGAAETAASKPASRADAYFNFTMGHMYAELAAMYGNRSEYISKAIDYYKAAVKADPGATLITEEIAGLYVQAGRLNEAVTEMEDRLKKDPKAVDALRVLGNIYARMIGDRGTGSTRRCSVRRSSSTRRSSRFNRRTPIAGSSWDASSGSARNSVEAEKDYRKALELSPDNEEAMTGLAMLYADLGDTKRAIEMLKQVADRNPSQSSLTTLAQAYENMRDYANAALILRKAVELDPSDLDIKRGLAQDLILANRLDEAIAVYNEIAEADPQDPEAFLRLSQIYRQQRDLPKARQALDRAKKAEPDNPEVRYNEVGLLEAEGRNADALARMKDLADSTEKKTYSAQERASRVVMLERLAILYRSSEQYPQAIETFQKIAALDPDAGARVAMQVVQTLREAKDFKPRPG